MSSALAPLTLAAVPELAGRTRELAILESRLATALAGRVHVVLLAGEPGIGKTRLLDEIERRARGRGVITLRGGASEAEGMPPYLPFVEALGRYSRTAPAVRLLDEAGPAAAILAAILPELTLRLDEFARPYPLPPEQARLRLYQAVADFLAAIAAPIGLVLGLDDLQWADAATLDLLLYVAQHQPAARTLIVAAYREGEAEQRPEFARLLSELTRARLQTTLRLGPLDAGEVAALAAGHLGGPAEPGLADLLVAQSEGSPFCAEELLQSWLETGAIGLQGAAWALVGPAAPALPPGIAGAVWARLSRLAPETVDLLRTAAIIGRSFDVGLLAQAVGQDAEAVGERLREAVQARLVRSGPADGLIFSHDKIRECLYDDVTPIRRRRLHGFIGRALEAAAAPAGARQMAELAYHFARSGDRPRGALYARQAAEGALRMYAAGEALAHFQMALELVDAADPARGSLLMGLGEAARLAGAENEAVAACTAAQAWFQAAGDPVAAGRAAHRLGQAWWRQEALGPARAAFEDALRLLQGHEVAELVQVEAGLGSLLAVSLHEQDAGLAHSRRGLDLARRLEDDRLVAVASRTLGDLLARGNDLAQGIPLLEQALALAAAVDDPAEASECCASLTVACFWQGAFRRGNEILAQRLAFARRCHDPYQLRHVFIWQAMALAFEGRWSEVVALLDQARVLVERLASPEPAAWLRFCRGGLAYVHGDYAAAAELIGQATAMFRAIGPGALVWYLGWLAMVQAVQGQVAQARATIDEVEGLLLGLPDRTMVVAEPLAHLTQAALYLGDRERLARYGPRLAAFAGQYHDALVDRLLGEIATLAGDWTAAGAYLAAAEAAATQEMHLWELAHTWEAQAGLALAQGARDHADRARALLQQALDLCRQRGFDGDARRVAGQLARLEGTGRGSARLPAGLSPREAEVLRLAASGKSNREIAQALYLSEYTVAHHLTNIFNKTGADNRAAAVAFAVRHGIAPA